MLEVETRFARAEDGAYVAYQVVGDGDLDLVHQPNAAAIDSVWDEPELAAALERAGSLFRIILFDRRGSGASDTPPHGRIVTAEETVDDTAVVMDAASSTHAVLLSTDSSAAAVLFAATSPHRLDGLVLLNSYARLGAAPDYEFGIPARQQALWLESIDNWDLDPSVELMCRPRAHDAAFRAWFLKGLRRVAPPPGVRALTEQDFNTDVRHLLDLVRVPTLVLHTAQNPYIEPAHGRYLADHIPGANFVELEGDGHHLAAVDLDAVFDEVTEQFTGERPRRREDRVFATVLFTDIVDSTRLATRLGDRRWRALLDRHDALVARQLERFSGRLIKTTGDGVVASFDGPARAIMCATAIRDGLHHLDIPVRIGLHAGEVELRGDDVSGIAVHIASRVQSASTAGQIVVSRTLVDLVAGSEIEFSDLGDHDLKGVPGQWRLFAVTAV